MTVSTGMQIPARGRYSRAPGELPVNENVGYNTYVPGSKGIQTLDTSSFNLAKQAASISAEGGQDIANALKGVGNSFRKLADTGVEIFRKNNELDMYKAQDLYSRLETLWLPKQEQLNELKGGDAVGASAAGTDVANDTETWIKEQKSIFGKEVEKLGSPAARRYFNLHSEELFTRASVWAKDRRNEQINVYEDGVAEASLASTSDSVVAAGGDLARAAQLYGQAMARIDATAARKGWSPEQTEQKKKEWAEKTALKSIQASLDAQDFPDALKRFQHFAPYLMGGNYEKAFQAVAAGALDAAMASGQEAPIQSWMDTFGKAGATIPQQSQQSVPTTSTPQSEQTQGWNAVASAMMQKHKGTKYDLYGESAASGKVSCSNWVKENFRAMGITGYSGSSEDIVSRAMKNKEVSAEEFRKNPRAGVVIGLDHGPRSYDQGREHGMDHVVFTYQDSKTGKIMVSEAGVRGGVHTTEVNAWMNAHPVGPDKKVKAMFIGDVLLGQPQAAAGQKASAAQAQPRSATTQPLGGNALSGLMAKAQKNLDEARYRTVLNEAASNPGVFIQANNVDALSGRLGGDTKKAQDAIQYAHSLIQAARNRERQAKNDLLDGIGDELVANIPRDVPLAQQLTLARGMIAQRSDLTPGDKARLELEFGQKARGMSDLYGGAAYGELAQNLSDHTLTKDQGRDFIAGNPWLTGRWRQAAEQLVEHSDSTYTHVVSGFLTAAKKLEAAALPSLRPIIQEMIANGIASASGIYNGADQKSRQDMDEKLGDSTKRDTVPIQQHLNEVLQTIGDHNKLTLIYNDRRTKQDEEERAAQTIAYQEKLRKDYAFVTGKAGSALSGDQASLTEAFVTARDAGSLRDDLRLWAARNPYDIPTVGGLTAYGEGKSKGIATVGDEDNQTKIEFGIRTLRGDGDEVEEIEAMQEQRGGVIDLTPKGIQATMDRKRRTADETILGIQKGARQ